MRDTSASPLSSSLAQTGTRGIQMEAKAENQRALRTRILGEAATYRAPNTATGRLGKRKRSQSISPASGCRKNRIARAQRARHATSHVSRSLRFRHAYIMAKGSDRWVAVQRKIALISRCLHESNG